MLKVSQNKDVFSCRLKAARGDVFCVLQQRLFITVRRNQ